MYEVFEEDVRSVDPGRLWELRYEDLIADPLGQMATVYRQLELGDFEAVRPLIAQYLARTEGYRTNRYELTDDMRRQITERWAPFLVKYGYEFPAAGGK
jgi:hypothetical protein